MQKHPEGSTNKLTTTSLVAHLARVPDPRVNRNKEHDLVDILVIAVCALLGTAESFNDLEDFGKAKRDWFKTFLKLRGGIPSHDTFNRVFAALPPEHFLECFLAWTQSVRASVAQEVVALDGKALRRAKAGDQSSALDSLITANAKRMTTPIKRHLLNSNLHNESNLQNSEFQNISFRQEKRGFAQTISHFILHFLLFGEF